MLVITRKVGERIVIGDSVVVTVIQTQRGRVRVGVEAPPRVLVLREELTRRRVPAAETPVEQGVGE
jgi:carbon storage regulator